MLINEHSFEKSSINISYNTQQERLFGHKYLTDSVKYKRKQKIQNEQTYEVQMDFLLSCSF